MYLCICLCVLIFFVMLFTYSHYSFRLDKGKGRSRRVVLSSFWNWRMQYTVIAAMTTLMITEGFSIRRRHLSSTCSFAQAHTCSRISLTCPYVKMATANVNTAVLPGNLRRLLINYHLVKTVSGTVLLIVGEISVSMHLGHLVSVAVSGLAGLLTGLLGLAAALSNSNALHVACLAATIACIGLNNMALTVSIPYLIQAPGKAIIFADIHFLAIDIVLSAAGAGGTAAAVFFALWRAPS